MNKNKDPEQDEFWNFLKKLERSNDKIDFGKLMQIKKKVYQLFCFDHKVTIIICLLRCLTFC